MKVSPTPENITKAALIIRSGGLVAFPTETVYGLGADARNDSAVNKIFKVKGRPSTNPLIVHIKSITELPLVTAPLSRTQSDLVKKLSVFWPGPLTLVLPAHPSLPLSVTAGQKSVGVRIPRHPVAQALLTEADCPIAAPSANPSTYVSPTRAEHVAVTLSESVDLILDGGPCEVGIESTILSLLTDPPTLLRAGGVSIEKLKEKIGEITIQKNTVDLTKEAAASPGLSPLHYSPRTPCALYSPSVSVKGTRIGRILFKKRDLSSEPFDYEVVSTLSLSGNLEEVASKLFATLYDFDDKKLDLVLIDQCPLEGIGQAIMDRLIRATAQRKG